ncbi:hypothetical protein SDC9_78363 [bioreactor metagenome]|uniref:Uncharacterized protein n=1 Tax=bioreactor metagenome TaxID=1076179 RepID=A0A644YTG7_9ZZZZ
MIAESLYKPLENCRRGQGGGFGSGASRNFRRGDETEPDAGGGGACRPLVAGGVRQRDRRRPGGRRGASPVRQRRHDERNFTGHQQSAGELPA